MLVDGRRLTLRAPMSLGRKRPATSIVSRLAWAIALPLWSGCQPAAAPLPSGEEVNEVGARLSTFASLPGETVWGLHASSDGLQVGIVTASGVRYFARSGAPASSLRQFSPEPVPGPILRACDDTGCFYAATQGWRRDQLTLYEDDGGTVVVSHACLACDARAVVASGRQDTLVVRQGKGNAIGLYSPRGTVLGVHALDQYVAALGAILTRQGDGAILRAHDSSDGSGSRVIAQRTDGAEVASFQTDVRVRALQGCQTSAGQTPVLLLLSRDAVRMVTLSGAPIGHVRLSHEEYRHIMVAPAAGFGYWVVVSGGSGSNSHVVLLLDSGGAERYRNSRPGRVWAIQDVQGGLLVASGSDVALVSVDG